MNDSICKEDFGLSPSGAEVTSLIFLLKHTWVLVSRINDVENFPFFSQTTK